MKLAIVGSATLAGSKLAADVIFKAMKQFEPSTVVVLPGNVTFNTLVRAQAARLSLPVEEMQPPRSTWLGRCLQSVRKRIVRGVYTKVAASEVDMVLAFKTTDRPGVSFDQLVKEADEAVVFTIRKRDNAESLILN